MLDMASPFVKDFAVFRTRRAAFEFVHNYSVAKGLRGANWIPFSPGQPAQGAKNLREPARVRTTLRLICPLSTTLCKPAGRYGVDLPSRLALQIDKAASPDVLRVSGWNLPVRTHRAAQEGLPSGLSFAPFHLISMIGCHCRVIASSGLPMV